MPDPVELPQAKVVTLHLESWQKRMLKDYLQVLKPIRVVGKIIIDFRKPVHLNTYRVPNFHIEDEGIEIYFTDSQKAFLEEATGLKVVDAMRLTKAMIEEKTIVIR